MQNVRHNDQHETPNSVKIVEVRQTSDKISLIQSMENKPMVSSFPANLISDLSHSDEDEASEVRVGYNLV